MTQLAKLCGSSAAHCKDNLSTQLVSSDRLRVNKFLHIGLSVFCFCFFFLLLRPLVVLAAAVWGVVVVDVGVAAAVVVAIGCGGGGVWWWWWGALCIGATPSARVTSGAPPSTAKAWRAPAGGE